MFGGITIRLSPATRQVVANIIIKMKLYSFTVVVVLLFNTFTVGPCHFQRKNNVRQQNNLKGGYHLKMAWHL